MPLYRQVLRRDEMSRIRVTDLTFYYEGSSDPVFEEVSFSIDTDWKLGFVGRNGKGKTTFLRLLQGGYEYRGTIDSNAVFDYFPYSITGEKLKKNAADFLDELKPDCEFWRVVCELEKLEADTDVLYRPFDTLSHGERTKVMLAVLFSGEHDFLLIDEPTNHLDLPSRDTVKRYLKQKKGFILVSHDRDLLDACTDHILVLNRQSIEIQNGNFSGWWENKSRKDAFAQAENEKHKKQIQKLRKAAERSRHWADQNESTKIGYDSSKEPDHPFRAYIGAKTKKMQSRVKQYERRMEQEIARKEGLLTDIESPVDLKIMPMRHHKETLLTVSGYGLRYGDAHENILTDVNFSLLQGERVFLNGANGSGKSSLIKAILAKNKKEEPSNLIEQGICSVASGLVISYINQDTSFLNGSIRRYCRDNHLEESLFCAILRQLDIERAQFEKNMEDFSEGQKKKVLVAASLLTPAHLYIWDEPLNYIDLFSRMQIEKLIQAYRPTMLLVEHDIRFRETIATKVIDL